MNLGRPIFLAGALLLAALSINVWLWRQHQPLPEIQGVYIPGAKGLADFQLQDHHQQPFRAKNLTGQWHLLAYGYTHCPDYCPTLLHELVQLEQKLKQRPETLQILFYGIDHQRDEPNQLATYLTYFSDSFIGLSAIDKPTEALALEDSLGIIYQLETPEAGSAEASGYSVAHGTSLYLLNPEGKLQAVLQPSISPSGIATFNADQLLQDYLRVRAYQEQSTTTDRIATTHSP